MSTRNVLAAVAAATALAAGGYALYQVGMHRGMEQTGAGPASISVSPAAEDPTSSIAAGEAATRRHIKEGIKAGEIDPATGKPVLYYHDPMVPGKRFDAPAKSPFMDMMLVPVYGGAGSDDKGSVTVSPRIQQNLGVRTAEVVEGTLRPMVSAVGSIAWNERDQSVVQARATGYIEKLHVRATLDRVQKGQAFADLYVPEWVAAQEEYLAVKRFAAGDAGLAAAARQRLLLAGMSEAQVARVDAAGAVQPRITLVAPSSGVVAELVAREGMTVSPGMMLARINGLASVWALAELPESQAPLVRPGSQVEARSPGVPGTVFRGTVQALLPEVNPTTRTLKARVQLANPGGQLVPGLFVNMQFMDTRVGKALLVPTEAVIQTGRRAVVMLAEEDGRFAPVDVETGLETGGQTEVKRGLEAGQRVVVSSQFLIDSEASLKGVEARLNNEPAPTAANTAQRHAGQGRIESMDRESVTLSHGPIASLGMGAMTMEFKLPPPNKMPTGLAVGDRVDFEFYLDPTDGPKVTTLTLLPPAASAAAASGASR
ncbi:efflux RND transporter periplasmic adaptor subunit [Methylibium petroleiphilum]|uniref:efflux RND transporter periplasmic adaptor subunit n=1 Tax=Methylibium petroleiphilum TaxID=105560 RepID=UPI003D2B5276